MNSLVKLAGVSAVLSVGLVTAFDAGPAVSQGTVKTYYDRVAPDAAVPVVLAQAASVGGVVISDASAGGAACRAQAWPYVSGDCIATAEQSPVRKPVRTITIERRDAPNTSSLIRMPGSSLQP